MLSRLFPRQIDNTYHGQWIGLWLLAPIVFAKMIMGANTMINTRNVIQGADAIPLESYGAVAAAIIVMSFKSWGLGLLLMASLGLLALIRYRSMAPLTYLLLTLENVGRKALQLADPLPLVTSSATPSIGAVINVVLIAALLVGFALSLTERAGVGKSSERRD